MLRGVSLVLATFIALAAAACGSQNDGRVADTTKKPSSSSTGTGTSTATPPDATSPSGTTTGPDGTPTAPAAMDVSSQSITVAGASRSYTLAVPQSYDASRAYPLVVAFHPDGLNGASMRDYHSFDGASGNDAIVAYATGTDQTWDLTTAPAQNQDMAYAAALVADVEGRVNIDASRIFAFGFSSGAFFVDQLACNRTIAFRGIAVNSGGAPNDPAGTKYPNGYVKCSSQEAPVAAFVVHGAADSTVAPDSGDYAAYYWAYVNGCTDDRAATSPSPCQQHQSCPSGKSVVMCLIPDMQHALWSDAQTAEWAFFQGL